jgi:TolB-like protein/Tfp pilus assembly protein PilF
MAGNLFVGTLLGKINHDEDLGCKVRRFHAFFGFGSAAHPMDPHNFFGELKRRNVYKVAVAYAVVAWLLIQIATQVFPFLEIPTWVVRLVIALVAIGFPIALVIAWAFEATPEGIKRTAAADARPANGIKNRTWIYVVVVGAVFSIALFFIGRYSAQRTPAPRQSEAATGSAIPQKSIAVLPFQNLSEEKANAYFAEGIQDEILTKLATVRDLKVISRTSTAKYQSKPDNLKTVANELGVATLLEGAVQKSGDKVRVNVQLIDARTDSHLWAKTYDRDFKDVFAVESEVAQEIADTLQAKLSPSESHALASVPTQDPQAYDLFLQGEYQLRAAESVPLAETYARAEGFYRQAIARDPKFAQAYAALAYCSLSSHWFLSRRTPAELTEVKSLVDRALELAPDSPEAHLSLAIFHYWGHRQYEPALAELDRTLNLQPNNAKARQYRAWILRRQGKWKQFLSEAKLAQELDPRDGQIPANIALGFATLREWNEAERYASRALAIDPNNFVAINAQVIARLNGRGDIEGARRALEATPERTFPGIGAGGAPSGSSVGTSVTTVTGGFPVYLHVIARRFADALTFWDTVPELKSAPRSRRLSARVAIQLLAGQTANAEAEEARVLLEKGLSERPDDLFSRTQLAWVYLALGRKADALRLSREVADLLTIEIDAILGAAGQLGLAEMEAWAGEAQEATNRLRHLLSIPSGISIARLKIDPVWDPIRNHPDFQRLLTGPEQIGPNK